MTGTTRDARGGEASALTELARRAKAHWPYPPELLARFVDELGIPEDAIAAGEVRVAEAEDATVLGVARLVPGDPAILEDLWIEPTAIGTGVGRRLWQDAIERARAAGARSIELDADPNAVGFYERMGARVVGFTKSPIVEGRRLPRMRFILAHPGAAER